MRIETNSIQTLPEYDDHRMVIHVMDKNSQLQGFIAIHRGGLKKPSFGATRLWSYATDIEAIKDALKLSKIMTYKSALAGLEYGGSKAVIIKPTTAHDHKKLIEAYALRVNYLGGHFITGADVGINPQDLTIMSKRSPHIVGKHIDPVAYTMLGVFYGIQAAISEIFKTESLTERTFAIQGLGKTGMELLKLISPYAKKIYASDINNTATISAKKLYPKLEIISPEEIMQLSVDVFCPCALSNTINSISIKKLKSKIVAGSANSQLESDQIGNELYESGTLYAPDYVINAGGLISVVDEYENKKPSSKRILKKVKDIKVTLEHIFAKSKRLHRSPSEVANEMAKKISTSFI